MIPQLQTEPIRPRTRLLVKRRRCPFLRGSAHSGWPDGQSSGSYGASVDRPEFVSAGLKTFPLGPGVPLRAILGQYDWRDSSSANRTHITGSKNRWSMFRCVEVSSNPISTGGCHEQDCNY